MTPEFDPSSMAAADAGIFGLPHNAEEAKLHLIPVPWETTTSYGRGAALGPAAVLRASHQVDLFDFDTGEAWKAGYFMDEISEDWTSRGRLLKEKAQERLEFLEAGEETPASEEIRKEINAASDELNSWVEAQATAKFKKVSS